MLTEKATRPLLVEGRRFMTGETGLDAGEICASCGLARAGDRIARAMSSTFNQTDLFLVDSLYICGRCQRLFQDKDSRSKCLLWTEPGKKQLLGREAVLPFLANPVWPFALSIPYSFQKHHVLYAGISQNGRACIGTDAGPVTLDYEAYDIARIISLTAEMLRNGVPRKELQNGVYATWTQARYGSALALWESQLTPLRQTGAIELIVRYQPATKNKLKTSFKGDEVYSETEKKAIALLASLAAASGYRKQQGMEFWGSYFQRRVCRHRGEKDINSFFSRMAGAINCAPASLELEPLESLDQETGAAVLKEIQTKTDLIIAAAYTALQAAKGKSDAQNTLF